MKLQKPDVELIEFLDELGTLTIGRRLIRLKSSIVASYSSHPRTWFVGLADRQLMIYLHGVLVEQDNYSHRFGTIVHECVQRSTPIEWPIQSYI